MDRRALLLAVILSLLLLAGSAGWAPAQEAKLRLPALQGDELAEGDLARGVTVVVVWASWSPRCRDIVERVNPIAQRWGDRARVITVNFQEDRETAGRFLEGKDLEIPVYLDTDGAFSKKYAVTTLPGLLIFKDGETAYRGRLPDDPDRLLSEIL